MASPKRKSKGVAILMAILFGAFGGNYFYMGNTGLAIVKLIVFIIAVALPFTVIGIIIAIPLFIIIFIWTCIDIIRYIFTSDERFQQSAGA